MKSVKTNAIKYIVVNWNDLYFQKIIKIYKTFINTAVCHYILHDRMYINNAVFRIGDLFQGLDTSNLLAVGLVAAGAIFVLPMLIYWLTGINLSAFNWRRSRLLLFLFRN